MKRPAAILGQLAAVSLLAVAADPPSKPPENPDFAFPQFLPGEATVLPLNDFPAQGKSFVSHGEPGTIGKKRNSRAGTPFRQVDAAEREVTPILALAAAAPEKSRAKAREAVSFSRVHVSPLAAMPFLGALADSPTGRLEKSRMLSFFRDDDRVIYLREWDLSAEGGGVIRISEYVTGTVNASPATLVVRTNEKAGAYWTLSWSVRNIDYELGLHEPLFSPDTADRLVSIAESIR
jgi:hypothetical protein